MTDQMDVDANTSAETNSQEEFSVDLLRVYYGRLFPYEAMFNWLSYGNDPNGAQSYIDRNFFLRREFSFTMEDDIYIRYQCFRDANEFCASVEKHQPHKIDIGAVFSDAPKNHKSIKPEAFKTEERELVFDIDMTDYDDIRTCCTGANICMRCWPYMTMAVKVLDESLRQDFGYSHILWVYSGRRGVHCWVCDSQARSLSNEARAAVVEYLSVGVNTGENSDSRSKNVFKKPIHHLISRAYETLDPMFERYIADGEGQGLLETRSSFIKILNSLPNEDIRVDLDKSWRENTSLTGAQRWRELVEKTSPPTTDRGRVTQRKRRVDYDVLEQWRMELVFRHCYPRLDANVSKSQNHLLKSPFCVHPKTGRVCIPIDPSRAEEFNPFKVPTVRSLCSQIDAFDREHDVDASINQSATSDTDKTDMKDAMAVFQRTFWGKLQASIRKSFRDRTEQMAAFTGDF